MHLMRVGPDAARKCGMHNQKALHPSNRYSVNGCPTPSGTKSVSDSVNGSLPHRPGRIGPAWGPVRSRLSLLIKRDFPLLARFPLSGEGAEVEARRRERRTSRADTPARKRIPAAPAGSRIMMKVAARRETAKRVSPCPVSYVCRWVGRILSWANESQTQTNTDLQPAAPRDVRRRFLAHRRSQAAPPRAQSRARQR